MELQQNFDSIYQTHFPKVFRLCKGYFHGDNDIAADTTQEVFIKVWENLPKFRNEANIGTWIYKIAANTCLMYLRKKNQTISISTSVIIDHEEKNDETEYKFKKMYDCINQLSPTNKLIIMMVLEDLEYVKIAEVIGITEENLRVRIHRIKDKLSKCVHNG